MSKMVVMTPTRPAIDFHGIIQRFQLRLELGILQHLADACIARIARLECFQNANSFLPLPHVEMGRGFLELRVVIFRRAGAKGSGHRFLLHCTMF
jgi:hypothetical protein